MCGFDPYSCPRPKYYIGSILDSNCDDAIHRGHLMMGLARYMHYPPVTNQLSGRGLPRWPNSGDRKYIVVKPPVTKHRCNCIVYNIAKTRKCSVEGLILPNQALVFTCLQHESFENNMGKGEIARNEQFLLFPRCFLSFWRTF